MPELKNILSRHTPRLAKKVKLFFTGLLFLFSTLVPPISSGTANPFSLAVLYPDIQGNYRKVFQKILQGVRDHPDARVATLPLGPETTPDIVRGWLDQHGHQAVLALGMRGYKSIKQLGLEKPVVVGALVISPNGITGISLAGSPRAFMTRLTRIAPQVRRVFIVYSKANSGWLVESARQEAAPLGLTIEALEATDSREAVDQFQKVLGKIQGPTDAVWLPLDSVIPNGTVLPMLLKSAWDKRFVIFSNNPSHTRKGALFSLYPDHQAMGRRLVDLTLDQIVNLQKPHVIATEDLKIAVNRRTASHLGLELTSQNLRGFDLVFPNRR
ncbi:MAG: hypothetical protein HQL52_04735 [Magnetococcales bacterium]|nr:hypothetical protein [Magnetococcales bacterium]